ncbi:hypothetical protein F0169_08325 [Pseudomonas sp. MAFF 212408]|uniref:Uncharacterized protein n=1 Tax=Pseudomonas kitaguniensis TaxID=2607908 RepID=A0A5N7KIR6_9PSED|nr:hypothetical protein [Pseudomonas kitaguniensis]
MPAMQARRCFRHTKVMPSRASRLPHKPAPTLDLLRLSVALRFCLFMGMAQPLAAVGQVQAHGRSRGV